MAIIKRNHVNVIQKPCCCLGAQKQSEAWTSHPLDYIYYNSIVLVEESNICYHRLLVVQTFHQV